MKTHLECTIEQEQVLADHLLYNEPLMVVPGEKTRIVKYVAKNFPGMKIDGVHLNKETAIWEIHLSEE